MVGCYGITKSSNLVIGGLNNLTILGLFGPPITSKQSQSKHSILILFSMHKTSMIASIKKLLPLFIFGLGLGVTSPSDWLPIKLPEYSPLVMAQAPVSQVIAVDSVGMTVADMDRSIDFYTKVLSFQKVSDVEVLGTEYERLQGLFGVRLRVVKLKLGNESIELTEYLTPKGRPIPIDSRSNDRWFQHIAIAVSDMDKAYQQLRKYKIQHASTAPQRIPDTNKAAAGIRAFYFKDPDGHNLEIIYFPRGKGDLKWQKSTDFPATETNYPRTKIVHDRIFLDIDHTAIVVSNTATSLKFYRDLLGLKLAGESTNYGTEQAHLNNVQDARLHISGLRSISGPGIEFLEYLEPKDGRSLPADAKPNDLSHWQTTLVVKDLNAIVKQLQLVSGKPTPMENRVTFISPAIVTIPDQIFGFKRGILVRDPDGHPMRLVEK
jgi:catechol 2,3-dioxygenase-like lactoylglutathione lyase family enzyme